jgi:peroxiredoxin Q/BCP
MVVAAGSAAPEFALRNQGGETVELASFRGRWVLLYWYPMADTPGCTAQAQGLRDQRTAFDDLTTTVLGASFDGVEALAAFHRKYHLGFDLLSDPDRAVGLRYGVAGHDGNAQHAQRLSFLIDPDGVVAKVYEVTEPGDHADRVLDDLEALQDAD